MNIYFRSPDSDTTLLHHDLLETSLFKTLQKLVPSHFKGVFKASEKFDYSHFYQARSALVSKVGAEKTVSVGIVPDMEKQLGGAILICTCPLAVELERYAKLYSPEKHMGDDWIVPFLRGYEKIIFLDRYDYAESIGFIPWVNMELIDHYPITFEDDTGVSNDLNNGKVKIVVIDHDTTKVQEKKEINKILSSLNKLCDWQFLTSEMNLLDQKNALIGADIHYHINYSNQVRAVLSPYDSIHNGVYTLIQPIKYKGTLLIDGSLKDLVDQRGYAYVYAENSELKDDLLPILRRIKVLRTEWLEDVSPDTARFKGVNQQALDLKLEMLLEVLD